MADAPLYREAEPDRSRGIFFWALIFYFLVEIVRPQDLFPALRTLRLGLLSTGLLVLLLVLCRDKPRIPPLLRGILALIVMMAVSIPFAPNRNWAFQLTGQVFLLFVAVLLPVYYFLDTLGKIEGFVKGLLVLFGLLAVVAIWNNGAGLGSWLKDENDVCLALDVAFAMGIFLWLGSRSVKSRIWIGALLLLYLAGIVASLSRGGFIGLVAVSVWAVWRSPHRLLYAGAAVLVAAVLFLAVPATYLDEMRSIPQAAEGEGTGGERFYLWGLALKMFAARPLSGWGPGNFEYAAHNFQGVERFGLADAAITRDVWGKSVHSVYLTILSELGLAGLGLFAWLILRACRQHRRLRRQLSPAEETSPDPDAGEALHRIRCLSLAIQGAIVAFLVAGVFISAFYYPVIWLLLALSAALERVNLRVLPEHEAESAAGEGL
jgi:O-antigen ligase